MIGVGGYAFTTTRNYVAGIEARAWDTERKLNILSKAIETLISSLTELKTAISSVSGSSSSESTYITSICTQVRVCSFEFTKKKILQFFKTIIIIFFDIFFS